MVTRYHITAGASTTAGGKVMSGSASRSINGARIACVGDPVSCPGCHSTGLIEPDGPRLSDRFDGRQMALSDDLCRCKCNPPPRLVANQVLLKQIIDADRVAECRLHHYVGSAATVEKAIASYQLTAEHLWMTFQKEAEDVIRENGVVIADDTERNRRINAAYAKLWLADERFQWAGLAAFASKQVNAKLWVAEERMKFVYKAAARFNELLKGSLRPYVEASLRRIAAGGGVE